eukprot:GEMP01005931.1.p1 GENE.GEMP01005931.1~~GEMP01005931.1.p1  ORF type:complete len:322 (-),score=102.40 GEMP01005931.1:2785-3750(-)
MLSTVRSRAFSKVAVLGAAGGIGQPLSLLMKSDPNVTDLRLFDVVNTPGVAADLSHICSAAQVSGFVGVDSLDAALQGVDVVIIPAGVPRKPGMTRDDLFNTNASIVQSLAKGVAKNCPNAMICVISNPVNSTVPIFAETLKAAGVYNPKRLFGVTTLDTVRARTFVAENQKFDVKKTTVSVIGGHAGTTILPLLSQVANGKFTKEEIEALTHRIQFGGDEVVKAKDGAGSATLSMAYAGWEFSSKLLRAMKGEKGIKECSFVENTLTDAPFFATPVTLGPNGIEEIHSYGTLSSFEKAIFDAMLPDLIAQAEKGIAFAKK